ncbi:MAG: hypothetical protein LDLANPLL_00652 [Turneriella sp.]|nr:hypothetical protein [Turneriella sp.]
MQMLIEKYDTIFIGSGIGTILCAAILARYRNEKVLILERHFKAGGFTHAFKRKNKFFWDVGIHYIGDLGEGSILRKLFDLISQGTLKWQKMPEVFEKFVYPDLTFSVYSGVERFKNDLTKLFTDEKENIEQYFEDIKKINVWFGRYVTIRGKAPFIDHVEEAFYEKEGFNPRLSTKEYLDYRFRNARLKALLVSQWGNYGLPPSESSFLMHAMVAQHYFNGGYYPVGGAHKIFESIEEVIKEKGGAVLTSHTVKEILIESGAAVGVRVEAEREDGGTMKEFYADKIISDAGSFNTYQKLLAHTEIPFRDGLNAFYKKHPVVTNVTLYLGLKDDPRSLGFHGENHWIYTSYDHDANFNESRASSSKDALSPAWLESGKIAGAYLSFPSLKDPDAKAHTAEIIAFTDYTFFQKWKDQKWKKRDEEYKALKEKISTMLIDFIDVRYPGFKNLIEYHELSTPITTEHFTDHPQGSIYGVPPVPERFAASGAPWCNPVTPFKNLYLTGADVSSPGIAGAMMGAVATLSQIPNGFKLLDLMRLKF